MANFKTACCMRVETLFLLALLVGCAGSPKKSARPAALYAQNGELAFLVSANGQGALNRILEQRRRSLLTSCPKFILHSITIPEHDTVAIFSVCNPPETSAVAAREFTLSEQARLEIALERTLAKTRFAHIALDVRVLYRGEDNWDTMFFARVLDSRANIRFTLSRYMLIDRSSLIEALIYLIETWDPPKNPPDEAKSHPRQETLGALFYPHVQC